MGDRYYAGIGSRSTPGDILGVMRSLAMTLAHRGWTLRSGGAPGADRAFDDGAATAMMARNGILAPEVYLPWPKFEGYHFPTRKEPQGEAYPIAAYFHPAWGLCSNGARALHARNVHQIMGADVTAPVLSSFVLCWTPGAKRGGGTGQALRIAEHYNVPIYDLADAAALETVLAWLHGGD